MGTVTVDRTGSWLTSGRLHPRRGPAVVRRHPHPAPTPASGATLVGEGPAGEALAAVLTAGRFDPDQTTVILRVSALDDVGHLDGIERLCIERGVRRITLVGEGTPGRWLAVGGDQDALGDLVPGVARTNVFVWGSPGFVAGVVAQARAAGVPEPRITAQPRP